MSRPTPLKLGVVADGNPASWSTNSGVARSVVEALNRIPGVEVRMLVDGSLRGVRRLIVAALSFRPSRRRWRAEYTKGRLATHLRTRQVVSALQREDSEIDVCLVLRNLYGPLPEPYVIFVDQTAAIAQREWPEWALPKHAFRWRLAADRRQYSRALMVATAGEYVAHAVVADYGIEASRVCAVGGGTRIPAVETLPSSERYRARICLFVGREGERKGLDVLLAAFVLVRERVPDARLWVAGVLPDGPLPKGVEVKGVSLGRDEVDDLYRQASVFCIPSRYEPFGLVALEAMAWQLPVVATDQGAFPEMFQGGAGVLVARESVTDLADALCRLLLDPAHAQAVGLRARNRVLSEYTWDAVAERIVDGIDRSRRGDVR